MARRQGYRAIIGPATLAAALSACTVGPDFQQPAAPTATDYTEASLPGTFSAGPSEAQQRLNVGRAIAAAWWELFNSSRLNEVVRLAIDRNQNLAAAEATLAQAQSDVNVTRGGLFPQVDFGTDVTRRLSPGTGPNRISTSYRLGPDAVYSLDLFGRIRRSVEQQQARAEVSNYQLAATYLALTGDVAAQVITIGSIRLQTAAIQDIVADDERNLTLVRQKLNEGKASELDLLTAQTQLANDRAQLPQLMQQLSIARHALAVLTGRIPSEVEPVDYDLADLTLPPDLPVSLPSALVRQRPDILASEAALHVANAEIGIATADMYPDITLSASLGQTALTMGSLFGSASTFWSLAAGLTAPIFHGGALAAAKQSAVAGFAAAAATYQQTVLEAFGQVADVLDALRHDAELVAAQRTALNLAERALALQRQSYGEGKSDVLQLIDSQRQYQQARLGYARASAQRFQDTVQLFVAMGGGWWDAEGLGAAPVAARAAGR